MTADKFLSVMKGIQSLWGPMSDQEVASWSIGIGDLSDNEADAALAHLIREHGYGGSAKPLPANFRDTVRPHVDSREIDRLLDEDAELAITHLERNWRDDAADFGPVLNATVRALGGLQALVDLMIGTGPDGPQWKFRRGDAKRLYRAYLRVTPGTGEGAALTTERWANQQASFPVSEYQRLELPVPEIPKLVYVPSVPARVLERLPKPERPDLVALPAPK